jgi:hypothetical protein
MIRGFVIKCDECGCDSHEINTENQITAQRVLVEHHGWKVYKTSEGLLELGALYKWNRACKECVQRYAIRKSKERQYAKRRNPSNALPPWTQNDEGK